MLGAFFIDWTHQNQSFFLGEGWKKGIQQNKKQWTVNEM